MSKLAAMRPHQDRALSMLRQSLKSGKRRPIIQAPTGFGKTLLAAAVVDGARRKGNRVLFVVPAISLIDQTVEAFSEEGLTDVGVMQGMHHMTDWSQPIQVASVQTMMRRNIPDAHVAVVDECHRLFDFYGKWFTDPVWADKPIIGLSATPWTKGLGKYYDDLIVAATTKELIDAGYLSKFRVFAPAHPDLSGVRTVAGDYHEGELAEAMDKVPLIADVVDTWVKRAENRPTLCFAVNRAHAKHLQLRFQEAGVAAAYIDAYTPLSERREIAGQFHASEVKVVCNVGCLTTGIDWDVRCIVLARPTKSEMLFVQMIGRGLRTAEAKEDCLILDHSDTHLRLGFVTDIQHEALDDGRARQKQERKHPLPKECPQCSFVKPPRMATCPACGFKAEVHSRVDVEDGELKELKARFTPIEKQVWYSQLLGVCAMRGYKPGWAANKYREKFGVWPQGLNRTATTPSPEIWSWVKSRQIAYAKGIAKRAAA